MPKKLRKLQKEIRLVYLLIRDPRVPWYAKALLVLVIGYALSPIDLIPDFLPVIGHLDDLVIVPFGIYLSLKLVKSEIVSEHRARIDSLREENTKQNWAAGIVVIILWLILLYLAIKYLVKIFKKRV